MTIFFNGGPYDGLRMGVIELQKHLVILSVPGRGGVRRFVYLPAIKDWPAVLAGRMRVDESEAYHYYELVSTPQGLQLRSDPAAHDYRKAVAGGVSEADGL